jgi:hypothetical protein
MEGTDEETRKRDREAILAEKKKRKKQAKKEQQNLLLRTLERNLNKDHVCECNILRDSFKDPPFAIEPQNKVQVGQFVISRRRGIIRNDDGSVCRTPPFMLKTRESGSQIKEGQARPSPLEPQGEFSLDLLKAGLYDPETLLPTVHFVIGRGCLKRIMKCFENYPNLFQTVPASHSEQYNFELRIKHVNNFIMIEDTEKWNLSPSFGYSFESFMTQQQSDNQNNNKKEESLLGPDCFFYRYVTYSLGELQLLIRYEVDCVRDNRNLAKNDSDSISSSSSCSSSFPSIEIKCHNSRFAPRYLDYWYSCIVTDTEEVVIGAIDKSSTNSSGNGLIESIDCIKVDELIPEDHEAKTNRFAQLYQVLQWIQVEFLVNHPDKEEGCLSYSRTKLPYKLILKIK